MRPFDLLAKTDPLGWKIGICCAYWWDWVRHPIRTWNRQAIVRSLGRAAREYQEQAYRRIFEEQHQP